MVRGSSPSATASWTRGTSSTSTKPPFERHQFGLTTGGPIRTDRTFFFGGVERLVESLGLTRVTTVPTAASRTGELWPVNAAVRPYLDRFPLPNGPELGMGLAQFTFRYDRPTRETFAQVRIDHSVTSGRLVFVRYTIDDAARQLPTSYPPFPQTRSPGVNG